MDPATAILFAVQIMKFADEYGIPAAKKIIQAAYKPAPAQKDWEDALDSATIKTDKFIKEVEEEGILDAGNK